MLKLDPPFGRSTGSRLKRGTPLTVIAMSPQGRGSRRRRREWRRSCRAVVRPLSWFDERVRERVTGELSIGDYVLRRRTVGAGGVGRGRAVRARGRGRRAPVVEDLQPWLPIPRSYASGGDRATARPAPRRRRNAGRRVLKVPDVLLSGNHAEIRRWRKREALSRTLDRRPDLLDGATLDEEEVEMLRELKGAKDGRD